MRTKIEKQASIVNASDSYKHIRLLMALGYCNCSKENTYFIVVGLLQVY